MSICYISEYQDVGHVPDSIAIAGEPSTDQFFSFTGTAGTSAAFQNNTKIVRITVDGIANVLFSVAGTAATVGQNKRMSAGAVEYFSVPQGKAYKLSAVTAGA